MIAPQGFYCPHCGAPGQVSAGVAEYSCTYRFAVSAIQQLQCHHIPVYDNMAKAYKCQVCGMPIPTGTCSPNIASAVNPEGGK